LKAIWNHYFTLIQEQSTRERKHNSSNEKDMSDIDYHRVNVGVDYADEIIDYDEEIVFDDDCP